MLKSAIRIVLKYSQTLLSGLKEILIKIILKLSKLRFLSIFSSWTQLLGILILVFIGLYYPVGGYLINKIDTNTEFEISVSPEQSATLETMSYLIKREVNDNLWTPNLPFIFPSYFLDNMPNFQLGIMSAVGRTTFALSKKLDKGVISEKENPLKEAAMLLQYPGTIWMFSPQNKLTPVPSANSQYRKGRRRLIEYNQFLSEGSRIFYKSPQDLAYFTKITASTLWKNNLNIENHIREYSQSILNNKADDLFYYTQGHAYAYYLIMRGLAQDYKEIIVKNEIYEDWIKAIKYLESASRLNPTIVRNGVLDSSFTPNHLASISYYTTRAAYVIKTISFKLKNLSVQGQ